MMKECPTHIDLLTGKTKKNIKCHTHNSFFRRIGHNWHCAILNCEHAKSILLLELWRFIKRVNAKLHLKYQCPRCNFRKRNSRDIYNDGECHWYSEWKKGNYNVPLNMGLINYLRVWFLRRKINYKNVYWEHMSKSERILRLAVTTIAFIGFVFWYLG